MNRCGKQKRIFNTKDYKSIYYPESRFGGFSDIDGIITFFTRVNALLHPSFTLLDIGCGRGAHAEDQISFRRDLRIFKGKCKKVIGIDIDEKAKDNPFIDEFYLIKDGVFPLESNSIDIAICTGVLEHVGNTDLFFSECRRVISPGGYLCITTANKISYIGIISSVIPNSLHSRILKIVQPKREEVDVFDTYYKCNTIRKLRQMLNKYDFDNCVYGYEAEPSYLSFWRFFYWLGVIHGKLAPNMIKLAIFAFGKNNKEQNS